MSARGRERTMSRGRMVAELRVTMLLVALMMAGSLVARASVENDDCPEATPITDGTYPGTTEGASLDGSTSCSGLCGCYGGSSGTAPDVWYLYTATCDGLLVIDTCGSDPLDTWLSIQEPGCSDVEVACNEDACGPPAAPYQSRVSAWVTVGEQKLVRVSGWISQTGAFELHASCTSPESPWVPGADPCVDAVELSVPATVRGTTVGADYDPEVERGVPGFPKNEGDWACGRDGKEGGARIPTPGVWYRVAGTGNRMTVSVDSPWTLEDTIVQVHCDGCDRPICVEAETSTNDRDRDRATWCSRSGQEYLIWVASREAETTGPFELSVTDSGTPCYGAVDCTPVELIDTYLWDNGDDDGWADTNETVEMRFTVANRSSRDVTGLVARLASTDPKVAGIGEGEVYIGSLAAGETRLAPGPFKFRVADVERVGLEESLSAAFQVLFASDQFEDLMPRRCSVTGVECDDHQDCMGTEYCANQRCSISGVPCWSWLDCNTSIGDLCIGRCLISGQPCGGFEPYQNSCETQVDFCVDESQRIELDLDLDATAGSGPTEFFDSFEWGGAAAFEEMNLDAGLHSVEGSDGYHCQYSADREAYWGGQPCLLGSSDQHADTYYWQVDDSRAFSGLHSLYMGLEFEPGRFTTPLSSLEAAAISTPINLGAGHACSGEEGHACESDSACPAGELCLVVVPELSFTHQISLADDRAFPSGGQGTAGKGVVQIQLVDEAGAPIGPWETIEPKLNRYDSVPAPWWTNCMFDPVDDGNTEDDRFDDLDSPVMFGMRYLSVGAWYIEHREGGRRGSFIPTGPSSNCFPRHVFASAGDTDEPFRPDNLNGPVVGPGLQGELGRGTWVEPVFSLDRFRGRRVRVRFLSSSVWFPYGETFYPFGSRWYDSAFDDGWWIDDVRVTHTLVEPATVTADTKDNSALAADADGDFVADSADCMPAGAETWAVPGEVLDVVADHAGGVEGTTTLRWARATTLGGTSVDYLLIAEEGESCSEWNVGASHSATDSVTPGPGVLRTFLVQAANGCGRGPLGVDSFHSPRPACD